MITTVAFKPFTVEHTPCSPEPTIQMTFQFTDDSIEFTDLAIFNERANYCPHCGDPTIGTYRTNEMVDLLSTDTQRSTEMGDELNTHTEIGFCVKNGRIAYHHPDYKHK